MKEKNRIIAAIMVFTVGSLAMRDLDSADAKLMNPIDLGFVLAALFIPRQLVLIGVLIAAFVLVRAFFAVRAMQHATNRNEELRHLLME